MTQMQNVIPAVAGMIKKAKKKKANQPDVTSTGMAIPDSPKPGTGKIDTIPQMEYKEIKSPTQMLKPKKKIKGRVKKGY